MTLTFIFWPPAVLHWNILACLPGSCWCPGSPRSWTKGWNLCYHLATRKTWMNVWFVTFTRSHNRHWLLCLITRWHPPSGKLWRNWSWMLQVRPIPAYFHLSKTVSPRSHWHWLIGPWEICYYFNSVISEHYRFNSDVLLVKLLSGDCHIKHLMIGQHFRRQCWVNVL